MAESGPMRYSYFCSKTTNPNYHVHIKCPGMGLEIIADMPEETNTAVGSEWEAMLPNSLADASAAAGGLAKTIAGTNLVSQALSQQVWVNSSPIEIPITLQFAAVENAYKEVVQPMRALEKLALPELGIGGLLYSPGPSRGSIAGGSLEVELYIGNLLIIPSVILINASSTFSSRLDKEGWPISGRSDITFRTDRVLSRGEWAKMTNTQDD